MSQASLGRATTSLASDNSRGIIVANPMKRRIWIGLGLLLSVIVIAVLAVPEYRLTFLGYLRGENRFEGLPTSYWRFKVDTYVSQRQIPAAISNSYWARFLRFFARTGPPEKPEVLGGNPKALPVLTDLIKDKSNRRDATEAYMALATMGQANAREIIPLLEEEINGQDPYFRVQSVRVLIYLGPEGVPYLIQALSHEGPDVREAAAYSLLDMALSPQDVVHKDAVPALIKALEDEVEGVRYWAARALLQIDPDGASADDAARIVRHHYQVETGQVETRGK
jgi:HEAT repeat protein